MDEEGNRWRSLRWLVNSRRWQLGLAVLVVVACVATGFLLSSGGDDKQPTLRAKDDTSERSQPSPSKVQPPQPSPSKAKPKPSKKNAAVTPNTVMLPHGGKATLVRKTLADDGTLPIPDSLDEATWWGADIGSDGAMLLSGHVSWQGAIGPFDELRRSKEDDVVTVVDGAGKKLRYRVSKVITLDKDELPARAQELFGQSGPHRLVLVTCDGRYVGGDDGYEDNRIVIATPARAT